MTFEGTREYALCVKDVKVKIRKKDVVIFKRGTVYKIIKGKSLWSIHGEFILHFPPTKENMKEYHEHFISYVYNRKENEE